MALKNSAGMLREWTFKATLEHKQARCRLRLLPQWVSINLDADEVGQQADTLRPYTAVKPFYAFNDITAPAKAGEMWDEVVKEVVFYRGRMGAQASLSDWCKRCIQLVIADERTISVDGEHRLHRLTVGTKISKCGFTLSGHRCFVFTFKQHDKTSTVAESFHIAVGTIINGSGYMIRASCTKEPELHAYMNDALMPNLSDASRFKLDIDITYPDATNQTLSLQQDLFGVFKYYDQVAAIEFSIPMHSLQMKPDHSPLQSAGFGSLTCLTLELDVYHKLYDNDEGGPASTIPGMPRYKANSVVLYIEVEDVIKLGFPSVMSVDQYSALKTQKLLDTFRDARVVGAPLSLQLGQRIGRATTCTFSYELEGPSYALGATKQQQRGVPVTVKALVVSTLVGSHGATAVFFTKLGQALFDTHVYIFHHLMKTLRFYTERELVGTFTKEDASRVRLTDQDLPRAYAAATDKTRLQKHLAAIQAATDGEVEDATVIVITGDAPEPDPKMNAVSFATFAGSALRGTEDSDSVVSVKDIAHLADLDMDDDGEDAPAAAESNDAQPHDSVADAVEPAPDTHAAADSMDQDPPSQDAIDRGRSPEQSTATGAPTEQERAFGAGVVQADDVEPGDAQLVQDALATHKEDDVLAARGLALRGIYRNCCEAEKAKPNSYLLQKLPEQARFTNTIEELDMSFNYVGHSGFLAILRLLRSLPKLHTVHFNSMSLDNSDVEALCTSLAQNTTIRAVHLRHNARVTLPSASHLLRLLRTNVNITTLSLSGCDIGPALMRSIEEKALENGRRQLAQHNAAQQPTASQPVPAVLVQEAPVDDQPSQPVAVG